MTARPTAKLGAYAGLSALGLAAALALGRPELAALAAPFGGVLAVGLALARAPELRVHVEPAAERLLEGDTVAVEVELEVRRGARRLDVLLALPPGLAVDGGRNPTHVYVPGGEARTIELTLRCDRWGGYVVGDVIVRARDPLGLVAWEARHERHSPLKVYPRPEPLRALLRPAETQVFSGNQVTRTKGEGIEFADLRPFVPGDRLRRVNWRASARRGELWVNEAHPERNADVVLFLDSFVEARRGDTGTLDLAVRAAAALAQHYLRTKDRVGLVGFGGILNWLVPATGLVQLYRIVDALLDTEITLSYAWKDVSIVPARTLPPKALVVALTPLLDERSVGALLDLRGRGFDVAVVELDPAPFAPPASDAAGELARRLWRLRREALRGEFERLGVPVVAWRDEQPLQVPIEEVARFKRRGSFARV